MDRVLEWVSLGRAARNNAQLKIRQPLSEMIVVGSEPLSEELASLVRDELNVKALSFEEDDRRLIDFTFKPQLRTLGRVMGGDLPKARPLIEALPGRKTMDALDAQGKIELDVDGTLYTLTAEDLLAEEVPMTGFAVEGTGDVKVALVTELTESLIEEGLVREIVSKVQTMRRAHDFEVTDRITLFIKRDEREAVLDRYADAIMTDVLADQIIFFDDNNALPAGVSGEKWDINGHEMAFAVVVS
jgi:isoleucyl-tRNA synthetase